MALDVQGTAVLAGLTFVGLLTLASVFSETRRLDHIPAVGSSNLILSYWSAIQLMRDPPGFLRAEFKKIPPGAKFAKIPGLLRWTVVPLKPGVFKDVMNVSDDVLSSLKAGEEFLQIDYTLFFKEIGNQVHVGLIRSNLSRYLRELVPALHDELCSALSDSFTLDENTESRSLVVMPEIMQIMARVVNRSLVGLPLCRNKDYIETNVKYATEVMLEANALAIVPRPLRPLAHRWLSPIPGRVKQISSWLQPLLRSYRQSRANDIDECGQDSELQADEQTTFIKWLVDSDGEDRHSVLRIMVLNLSAIHTLTITFTHAFYSILCRPQYIEPLRAEIDQWVEKAGWTKESLDGMRLLDSFIKESHRFDLMSLFVSQRMALQDCSVTGVSIPKGTMVAGSLMNAHFDTDIWGPDANEFDPYRFIKLEEGTGRKMGLVTTSDHMLSFGYGPHACPGRFFAAATKKLIMAHLLYHYDMELDTQDGLTGRPQNVWIGSACVPNRGAKVSFRRRVR